MSIKSKLLVAAILVAGGIISCQQKKQDNKTYTSQQLEDGNFKPSYEYSPMNGVDVQLFPPRIRGVQGVSLSQIEKTGETIKWKSVLNGLKLNCTASMSNGKMELEMAVTNSGKSDELVAIRYPEVHYLMKDDSVLRVLNPTFGGVLEPLKGYPIVDTRYPGAASFCATLVAGNEKSLGIALRNGEQRSAHIRHLTARPAGQMSIELDRVLVKAGQTVELPTGYIASGDDWADVLKPYKDWFANNFKPKMNPPAWIGNDEFTNVRNAHCMVPSYPPDALPGIWIFDRAFKPRSIDNVRKDIDKGFEVAKERGGKPLFYQFGWWKSMETFNGLLMFDAVCGDYTKAHDLTVEGIKYLHSKGGKVFLYTNFISAGEETEVFRDQPELFVRDANGAAIRNAGYPMYLFCPGAPGMKDYWDKVLNYIFVDLDADGVFLDQLGGGTDSPICCDPTHNHDHFDTYGADYLKLEEYVTQKVKSLKPDALVCCELINDVRSMWIDQVHGFGYARPSKMEFATVEQAANTPPNEYMVFLKYINPHAIMEPDSRDNVALGAPGRPNDEIWMKYKSIFQSGLLPLHTNPVGAMAYLYGPVNGEAILATRAWVDIKNVVVKIPESLVSVEGGTDVAKTDKEGNVIVEAGMKSRFYRFKIK